MLGRLMRVHSKNINYSIYLLEEKCKCIFRMRSNVPSVT